MLITNKIIFLTTIGMYSRKGLQTNKYNMHHCNCFRWLARASRMVTKCLCRALRLQGWGVTYRRPLRCPKSAVCIIGWLWYQCVLFNSYTILLSSTDCVAILHQRYLYRTSKLLMFGVTFIFTLVVSYLDGFLWNIRSVIHVSDFTFTLMPECCL